MKQHIAILCGGSSYEHEVSIISGIQIAENIDTQRFSFSFIYFDKNNQAFLIKNFKNKRSFKSGKRVLVDIVGRNGKAYLKQQSLLGRTIQIDACYLAFHGGSGESGQIQGLLETIGVPFTSSSMEGSAIAMNKAITKEVLTHSGIPMLPWVNVMSCRFREDASKLIAEIEDTLSYPLIIKPAHLGSSIGIQIVHNKTELEKSLMVATRLDTEVLVETALTDFTEYNISVRSNENILECSPIEEPLRKDAFLSFDDKYANGSKKSGGGMESLDRKLPAAISQELADTIMQHAKNAYRSARLSGVVRIDFMYAEGRLVLSEINPIPGSLSFYLWEASGEQFSEQITKSIEDAFVRFSRAVSVQPYATDIVDAYIG